MRARGKRKGKADPGAAMAYLRRLHGDPDNAPFGDLADLAEREQTTDTIEKKKQSQQRR